MPLGEDRVWRMRFHCFLTCPKPSFLQILRGNVVTSAVGSMSFMTLRNLGHAMND